MYYNKGMNLESVKLENRSTIIRVINTKGPMSRKDIADIVGLTPATVTLLCNEMISEGLIYETGDIKAENRAGRKKILLDINYNCKCVVSVNIDSKNIHMYICDLKANPIIKSKIETNKTCEPEVLLKSIADNINEMILKIGKTLDDILGIGISIPGIVDRLNGISVKAYGIWKEPVSVKEILEKYLNCDIIVENNIKAFAHGELIYGLGRKKSNILFLRWGPGVGAAMIIDNKLYEGRGHNAMEIGHYIVDPVGDLCKCGRRGCLETKVSVGLIFNKINNIFSNEETPKLYKYLEENHIELSEESFSEWISNVDITDEQVMDEKIYEIIYDSIDIMAVTISNVTTLFSPDEAIIFGTMFKNVKIEEIFLSRYTIYSGNINKENIQKSKLGEKINYIGPVAIVTKELFFQF